MPFRSVPSVACAECGKEFSGKDPKHALWVHLNRAKVPCVERRRREQLEQFKRTLRASDLDDALQTARLRAEMDEMKRELHRLREEVKEKQTLHMTIVHLSPQVLAYEPTLVPIQTLDALDLDDARFRKMRDWQYPFPQYGLCNASNAAAFQDRARYLQSVVPFSVRDGVGNVFYKDGDVLKWDPNDTVCIKLLQTLRHCDAAAMEALNTILDEGTPEEFRRNLRKRVSDIHIVL